MSVIEEALRRAQGPLHPQAPTLAPKTSTAQVPAQPAVYTPPQAPVGTVPAPAHSWTATASSISASSRSSNTPIVAAVSAALGLSVLLLGLAAVWLTRHPATSGGLTTSPAATAATAPLSTTTVASLGEGLALSGIVLGGNEPYAVINGTIITVGERLDGYLVSEITETTVTLKDARGRSTLLQLGR